MNLDVVDDEVNKDGPPLTQAHPMLCITETTCRNHCSRIDVTLRETGTLKLDTAECEDTFLKRGGSVVY